MKQWFDEKGRRLGVTILAVQPMTVSGLRTQEKNGYDAWAFKLQTSSRKPQIKEVRVNSSDFSDMKVGDEVSWVDVIKPGDWVDVTGVSKGHGFTGVVKRYHFAGGPRTHGQSDRERAPGSIGSTTTPGRVMRGKKMAGRMGNATTVVKNLQIVAVDADQRQVWVAGSIPGAKQKLVTLIKV